MTEMETEFVGMVMGMGMGKVKGTGASVGKGRVSAMSAGTHPAMPGASFA
jgi:hypothetical protein